MKRAILLAAVWLSGCVSTATAPPPASSAPIQETPQLVSEVQSQLNAKGYDVGRPDGIAGPRTREAIRKFEAANNLPADGNIDAAVLAALRGSSNKPAGSSRGTSGQMVVSDAGLEPVGPVKAPGCSSIEVVGYAEQRHPVGGTMYFMAVRNNDRVAHLVNIEYIGGRRLRDTPMEGNVALNISPGEIKTWNIDYAETRPKKVAITGCR